MQTVEGFKPSESLKEKIFKKFKNLVD
jgi:hypothetical protein